MVEAIAMTNKDTEAFVEVRERLFTALESGDVEHILRVTKEVNAQTREARRIMETKGSRAAVQYLRSLRQTNEKE
jgi:hypothetical protein